MGFDKLLGNEQLRQDLAAARQKGKLAHFYLISGPAGSGKRTLADLLAAAMLCRQDDAPCGVCPDCRKVFSRLHPDDITIDDPEKKTVPVELIRQARADIYIRPNEGEKKIYRFPRAQDLGLPGQNALLKVLEEPPPYGVFLLLTDNPAKLLPTIRSRCVELKLRPLPEEILLPALQGEFPDAPAQTLRAAMARSGGYLGQARELLSGQEDSPVTAQFSAAYAARDVWGLLQTLVPMEKWKRDQLIPVLEQWVRILEQALLIRTGGDALSPLSAEIAANRHRREIMEAVTTITQAIDYARGNVSCAAVCGWLQWALR